jgi:hypothetical protein
MVPLPAPPPAIDDLNSTAPRMPIPPAVLTRTWPGVPRGRKPTDVEADAPFSQSAALPKKLLANLRPSDLRSGP